DAFEAMKHFTARDNLGRMNIYKVQQSYVLLDYGHNSDAFRCLIEMLKNFCFARKTLLFSLPGDRDTALLKEVGEIVSQGFHQLFIADDKDLRGRAPGEVPELIRRICSEKNQELNCQAISSPEATLAELLKNGKSGE